EVINGQSVQLTPILYDHLVKEISNRLVNITMLEKSRAFSREKLEVLQKNFDLIILLGRNINICGELLHTKQGLYSQVANQLPILVLHK
ncbi:MAG: hypothetical protein R3218_07195, partial [Christiangramia sp.]|nr:hypothetical protein [Christiangramia sp.]